jgi:hypothetical protein
MPLTLRRRTGLSSPAYRDWLDYVIVEDGRDVGRVYLIRSNSAMPSSPHATASPSMMHERKRKRARPRRPAGSDV